jgi:hypothetical protein
VWKLIGSHLERNCVVGKRLLAPQELVEDDPGDVLMTAEAFGMSPTWRAMASRRCASCAGPASSPARRGPA